jgi:hypothetical protein
VGVAFGSGGASIATSDNAAIWLHVILMLFSWGTALPFGATVARYRKHTTTGGASWFKTHRNVQYAGWALQIGGFVSAVFYIHNKGLPHFQGDNAAHKIIGLVVVILGTLQPLNAFVRPHARAEGEEAPACCGDNRSR